MNNRNKNYQNRQDGKNHTPPPSFNVKRIVLSGKLDATLFSQVAEDAAKNVAATRKPTQTQLRKFYDEICMWDSKCQAEKNRFEEYLPFILMLKAKVAYAKGRKLVNDAYADILNHCLSELESNREPETLHNLKLFMEAFTGFYKVYGPKN